MKANLFWTGTVGTRLFTTAANAHALSWLIRPGEDFPSAIEAKILSWGINLRVEKLPGQKSTRGLLVYEYTTFGRRSREAVREISVTDFKYSKDVQIRDTGHRDGTQTSGRSRHAVLALHQHTPLTKSNQITGR